VSDTISVGPSESASGAVTSPIDADAPSFAASGRAPTRGRCRFCDEPLHATFVDLGMSPLCQRHVTPEQLDRMEAFHPLHVRVCTSCFLVQLAEYVPPEEIFEDYAYFSSYSDSWLAHAERYVETIVPALGLDASSLVVELASNDGYLLQYMQRTGIRTLGVEPAKNVAEAAIARGIPTVSAFFGRDLAARLRENHGPADLIVANNVLAHVPDINDFVGGIAILLATDGLLTAEFPHLHELIAGNQFDTIYHEHFSYLGFLTVRRILRAHGLEIVDVERLATHGGSLRIHARRLTGRSCPVSPRVAELVRLEQELGYDRIDAYRGFGERVAATKRRLLAFLIDAKERGASIAGYGAPGKGNTLLNYCGIRTDFLDYTVDRNPKKQGNFLPGTRIPIRAPEELRRTRPDLVLILPWNLRDEIVGQHGYVREWGGRFVVPIPELQVL